MFHQESVIKVMHMSILLLGGICMNSKLFKDTAKRHVPTKHKGKHAMTAFICGGAMGLFGQLLMMMYQDVFGFSKENSIAPMIVTVVFITSLATGLGIYDKIAQKCGAGLFIPISGFANSLTSAALEGRSEGPIYGIGANMFKLAGSVLTYGVAAAFIFGMLRFIMFGG